MSCWVFTIPCSALPYQKKKNNSEIIKKFRKSLLQSKGQHKSWSNILRVARYDHELRHQLRQIGAYPSPSSHGWFCTRTNEYKLELAETVAWSGDYDWAATLFLEQLYADEGINKDFCYITISLKYSPKLYTAGLKTLARTTLERAISLMKPLKSKDAQDYQMKALVATALIGVGHKEKGLALMSHMLQDAEDLVKQGKHSLAQKILKNWFFAATKFHSRSMPRLIRKAHGLLPLKSFRPKTRMYAAEAMTNNGLKTGSIKDILTAIQWWGAERTEINTLNSLEDIAWGVCTVSDSKRLLKILESQLPQSITKNSPGPIDIPSELSLTAVEGCLNNGQKQDARRLLTRAWNVHHARLTSIRPRESITFLVDFVKLSQKIGIDIEIRSQVLSMTDQIKASDYVAPRKASIYGLLNRYDKVETLTNQLKEIEYQNLAWTYAAQSYITLNKADMALLALQRIMDVKMKKSYFSSTEKDILKRTILLNALLGRWKEAEDLLISSGKSRNPDLLASLLLISLGHYDASELDYL
ncbi:MAG: hypothetical protein AAF518_17155 [Spirochaetota bacterium]